MANKRKVFFDAQKFSYKCSEGGIVTLKHKAGHELRVAVDSLGEDLKKVIKELESNHKSSQSRDKQNMYSGGGVKRPEVNEFGYPDRFGVDIPKEPKPVASDRSTAPSIRSNARKEQNERMLQKGKTIQEIQLDEKNNPMYKGGQVKRYADGGQVQPSQDEIMAMINANAGNVQQQPQYIDQQPQVQQPTITGALGDMGRALMTPAGQPVPPAPQEQPQAPMGNVAPQAPMPDMGSQQPQAPVNADPAGMQAYSKSMLGGLDMQKQALETQYQAAAQQAKERAVADTNYMAQTQQIMNNFNNDIAKNQANMDATIEDIKANVINPKAYQQSMTTGNKIATAIGMMAGGFGQAFVGGDNPAMTFLNQQIDRDIKAQEANQGRRVTLLNAYQNQFRNKVAATDMAKATLNSLYASQLSLAANKAATPQAKAQMLMGVGQLQIKAAELVKSATLSEYMTKMQSGGGSPEQQVAIMEQINPEKAKELRQRMVPGIGFATTNEGAKTVADTQIVANNVKKDLSRLRQIMSTPAKSLSLNARAEADTIRRSLVGSLRLPITGPGAMSEGERELLLQIVPDVTALFSIDSNSAKRLDTIEQKMDNSYKHTLEANGLKMPAGFARNPNEGKVAVNASGQRIIMKNGQWVPYGQ